MKAVTIHRFLDVSLLWAICRRSLNFLQSNSFQTGASNVLSLWDQIHQLHECLNASSQILEQSGLNPTSMLNQIDTVLTGIASLQDFYMQVKSIRLVVSSMFWKKRLQIRISLERFMEQLKREEVLTIGRQFLSPFLTFVFQDELQDLEHEVRWLTAMSADLRAFSKTPSPVNEPYVETWMIITLFRKRFELERIFRFLKSLAFVTGEMTFIVNTSTSVESTLLPPFMTRKSKLDLFILKTQLWVLNAIWLPQLRTHTILSPTVIILKFRIWRPAAVRIRLQHSSWVIRDIWKIGVWICLIHWHMLRYVVIRYELSLENVCWRAAWDDQR